MIEKYFITGGGLADDADFGVQYDNDNSIVTFRSALLHSHTLQELVAARLHISRSKGRVHLKIFYTLKCSASVLRFIEIRNRLKELKYTLTRTTKLWKK